MNSQNNSIGVNVSKMSLESKRLYCLIKLVSDLKPKNKKELLLSYDNAVDELIEDFKKNDNEESINMAIELQDMKDFVDEHLEDVENGFE